MAARRRDDQTARLWVEPGESRVAPLIGVAPLAPIDKIYTFTANEDLVARLRVGQRVSVPFGRRRTIRPGIVVEIAEGAWTSSLRSICEILDPAGEINPHLLELGRWIARYYAAPLGRTLSAMVPQAVRSQRGFVTMRLVRLISEKGALVGARLGKKQTELVVRLRDLGGASDSTTLLESTGASRTTLRALIAKGIVVEDVSRRAPSELLSTQTVHEPEFNLNEDQRAALERASAALAAQAFRALLLFGVSGSGKTEVYIRAMRQVLSAGRQAIMLVPEIALTTQLVQRLAARFARVAVVHSGLSEVQRSLTWEAIRTGAAPVVIGTRSAVFAPCPNLGLIVVDEEQEPSYKNLQSPRFHVRDVAVKRAHMLGIPIVLGSATPSLETWRNAEVSPAYERVDLPRRVRDLPLPDVHLVDMRLEGIFTGALALSRSLLAKLATTLERRRQAVILLNRRGFATFLYCATCGHRLECPQCKANLVLHLARRRMLCHHCHAATPMPTHCPDISCRGRLEHGGSGTERVEQQLREAFPQARLHRADSDTMTHADKYQSLVDQFAAGEIDVLVGTQMIAKGLDFPNVELVGVVGADLATAGADFRAAERLFQLVTQVAGRAGRADAAGRVVVQTLAPETPALRFAVAHDFCGFVQSEMRLRKQFNMPPFSRLARCVLSGSTDSITGQEADALADRLRTIVAALYEVTSHRASVIGAHPCAVERIRGAYRHEVLIRTADPGTMREILDRARLADAFRVRGARMMIDVDPVNLT